MRGTITRDDTTEAAAAAMAMEMDGMVLVLLSLLLQLMLQKVRSVTRACSSQNLLYYIVCWDRGTAEPEPEPKVAVVKVSRQCEFHSSATDGLTTSLPTWDCIDMYVTDDLLELV
jgi:hypothetical protein